VSNEDKQRGIAAAVHHEEWTQRVLNHIELDSLDWAEYFIRQHGLSGFYKSVHEAVERMKEQGRSFPQ
jgi:hypothetical protein